MVQVLPFPAWPSPNILGASAQPSRPRAAAGPAGRVDDMRPCQGGCGLAAAPGSDRWGVPFDTCCRGCATGRGHEDTCAGFPLPPAMDDEALAMAMQVAELEGQHQAQTAGFRAERHARAEAASVSDQLWGDLPSRVAEGAQGPPAWRRAGFFLLPCCFVPCTSAAGRRAWRTFLLSWSVTIALAQVVILVVAIQLHGGFVGVEQNPSIGPHYHALDAMGAKNVAKILHGGEWWRILTPMLLHGGVMHLVGNLLVQLRTAAVLELLWGHSAWLLVYVVSGAYATLASCVVLPKQLGVGSSGSLCGLIGAWLSFTLITWNQTLPYDIKARDQQVVSIIFSILMIIGLSFMPMLDFAAHIGGLISGASLAMAVFAGRLQHRGTRWATRCLGVVICGGLIIGTLLLLLYNTEVDDRLFHLCVPSDCK